MINSLNTRFLLSKMSSETALSNQEFGQKLRELANTHTDLMKLQAAVAQAGKGEKIPVAGKEIGRTEVRSLSSQFKKELRALKKDYVLQGKRKKKVKRARDPSKRSAFETPDLASDALRQFFANSNLGVVNPSLPESAQNPRLNSQFIVGQNGVTSRAVLTQLFNIYIYNNRAQMKRKDAQGKSYLVATPEMNQYFSQTFAALEAQPGSVSRKTGKTGPRFNRNNFRYADISKIVSANLVPKAQLTEAQKAEMAQFQDRLDQEKALGHRALESYKALAQ